MLTKMHWFALSLAWLAIGVCITMKTAAAEEFKLTFADTAQGGLPKGWRIDATNPSGKLAEWKVVADADAPSKPNVLTISKINDTSGSVFNLCWTPDIVFQEGEIEVKVRANTGSEDQGGGMIWRVRDANNYYVARYNPLESNFRLYYVKTGDRRQIASARGIDVKAGTWFTIKIVQHGEKMEGYLNGKKYLEATDKTFTGPGGVGLWSKSDAASSFDDLAVVSSGRN